MPNHISANFHSRPRNSESTRTAIHRAPSSPMGAIHAVDQTQAAIQRVIASPLHVQAQDVPHLQRLLGNQMVGELLARKAAAHGVHQSDDHQTGDNSRGVNSGDVIGPDGGTVSQGLESTVRQARSGGVRVPTAVRRTMEERTGQAYDDVTIHTGKHAHAVNDALGARAATYGKHVFLARQESPHDLKLMAHELTHVTQQTGGVQRLQENKDLAIRQQMPAGQISAKRRLMHLDFVRMKRQDPNFGKIIKKKLGIGGNNDDGAHDTYGHWWTEIGDLRGQDFRPQASYGWWPKDDAPGGLGKLFGGVEGALNGEGPTSTHDPHEDDPASVEFHPAISVDPEQESYAAIRQRVTNQIQQFATGYSGKWHWKLGWGKNCHTFQQKLKTKANLHFQKAKQWLIDPQVEVERQEAVAAEEDRQQAKESVLKTYTLPEGRTVERLTAEGQDLRAVSRGPQVGATGVMIPFTFPSGLKTNLVEYIDINVGNRYYAEQMTWEHMFGEPYPQQATEESTGGGDPPTNMGTGNNSLILNLDDLY